MGGVEKKVTEEGSRVGIIDEWLVEPTDHRSIPVQLRLSIRCSLPDPGLSQT